MTTWKTDFCRLACALGWILGAQGCSDGGGGDTCGANLAPGVLVLTEIMGNPAGTDEGKEWFEMFNDSSAPIDLTGVKLVSSRADGTGEAFHVIAGVTIEPRQYLVLGGMLDEVKPSYVDYAYGSDLGSLRNTGGRLSIECGSTVIDRVVYLEMGEGISKVFDGAQPPNAVANDNLEFWCDARLEFEPGSTGSPGTANEACEGGIVPTECKENGVTRDVVAPQPGDVVITEFMPNPNRADDTTGEWFEVRVARDIDLNGLQVGNLPGTVKATVSSVDCIKVTAGEFLVFARSADSGLNGGLPQVDQVVNVTLANTSGSLFIGRSDQVLDQVQYTGSGDGSSTSLDPTMMTPEANDNPDYWCRGSVAYGLGDLGTPGASNPSCGVVPAGKCIDAAGGLRDKVTPVAGQVVITEFMANPAVVSDTNGEWFEVLVTAECDLNGLQSGTSPASPVVLVPEGNCLRVTAGGYALFARNALTADNGGLPEVDRVFNFGLTNSGGSLFVGLGGEVFDSISWASVSDGRSTSLSPAHLNATDNDNAANWCPGSQAYGTGANQGSPRAANPACP